MVGVKVAHNKTGIPYETIYRAAKDGRIEGSMQVSEGGVWIFPWDSFETWRDNHYRPHNKEKATHD